jgi:prolipoprotein diacylglyceryltransferase
LGDYTKTLIYVSLGLSIVIGIIVFVYRRRKTHLGAENNQYTSTYALFRNEHLQQQQQQFNQRNYTGPSGIVTSSNNPNAVIDINSR